MTRRLFLLPLFLLACSISTLPLVHPTVEHVERKRPPQYASVYAETEPMKLMESEEMTK